MKISGSTNGSKVIMISSTFVTTIRKNTEAKKGQSKNILQIPQNISNRNIFFKITVEKFDKSKKLLQIL